VEFLQFCHDFADIQIAIVAIVAIAKFVAISLTVCRLHFDSGDIDVIELKNVPILLP
jgi:hypothetical protein